MSVKLYHNPRCSKSRQALALLEERGVDVDVVRYLDHPPSKRELTALVKALGDHAPLLRRKEKVFQEKHTGKDLDRAATIAAILEDPILMERPVAVVGDRAVIGRPPERVLELL